MFKSIAVLLMVFLASPATSQTPGQTIDFINGKAGSVVKSPLEIKAEQFVLKVFNRFHKRSATETVNSGEPGYNEVNWHKISGIHDNGDYVAIITKGDVALINENRAFHNTKFCSFAEEPIGVAICFNNEARNDERQRFIKALRHMATINGAALASDDLFK